MFWRIELTIVFLLCAAATSAHEPIVLDARRATPGLHLELSELPSTPDSGTIKYRLQAVGLPPGVIFGVWAKDFGHSFHEVASGFQMDGSGNMVSSALDGASWVRRWWRWIVSLAGGGRPQRLDDMAFGPGPYPRGAVWEVAIVSADRALNAFAKVIPQPIMVRDGLCTVSLELVSHRGERFLASGTGFTPGDNVITESRYAGRISQKRQRISIAGFLLPEVISHGESSTDHNARYVVKGHSCEVAVEYEWGEPALRRHELR